MFEKIIKAGTITKMGGCLETCQLEHQKMYIDSYNLLLEIKQKHLWIIKISYKVEIVFIIYHLKSYVFQYTIVFKTTTNHHINSSKYIFVRDVGESFI